MKADQCIEAICRSEEFRDWQEHLAASFYDKARKDTLIREVREAVAARACGSAPEEAESLQRAVIGRLVALASQAAERPPAPEARAVPTRSARELANLIREKFPYPIAVCYRRFLEAKPGAGKFGCLLDTFESLLHYLATIVLSTYWRDGAPDPTLNRLLLEKFYKGKWATGDLMALLRETAKAYLSRPDALPYPELIPYLFTHHGHPTASLTILEGFVTLRTDGWGHTGGRDDALYVDILPEHGQRLGEELNRCDWLSAASLWLPKKVDENGRVTVADLLNGDIRFEDAVSLPLDPKDLDLNGGDIVLERTLLVVHPETGHYVPLFPLSLFHFQQIGQGPFFLSDLDWADEARWLKKARYLNYELVTREVQGNRCEVRAGDPAVQRLEAKVHQLAALLREEGVPLREMRAAVHEAKDYNLREVWAERDSHVKMFAGREGWLRQLQDWASAPGEGGYLLLVGPPGQGKSALLAQLARRELEGAGCLFHMVKSHKNPRHFLQFLLWQAAQWLNEPLIEAAYQGDVSDLGHALYEMLGRVWQRRGRALMIIDALDELDPGSQRLDFLPEHLPEGVRVILSCRPEMPLVAALQQRLRSLTIERLPPLTAEDLLLFLAQYLPAERLQELRQAIDFEALFRRTEGNALFLKRAMERILTEVQRAEAQGVPVPSIDVSVFPNTVDAVFEDIYNEIAQKQGGRFTSDDGRLKARMIQLLAITRQALSLDELRGLLFTEAATHASDPSPIGLHTDVSPLSLERTRDLMLHMSEYLLVDDEERFLPFHQGLTDYLRHQILGDHGIAGLHRVFCQWLSTPAQRRSPYRLRHLVAHLFTWKQHSDACGMVDASHQAVQQLMGLLSDFDFIEAKVQAEMTFELVGEYQAALPLSPSPELWAWARFIDGEGHLLSHAPSLFFQQALNQPDDDPVAQAAAARLPSSPPDEPYMRWQNKPWLSSTTSLLRTFARHTDAVTAVTLTPDGRHVVSGSRDTTLKVWELATGREVTTFAGHAGEITAVAVTPDGWLVLSGNKEPPFWKLKLEEELKWLTREQRPHSLKVWELTSGREVASCQQFVDQIYAAAITSQGWYVAAQGPEQQVTLWEISIDAAQGGASGRDLAHFAAPVMSLDGRYVVTCEAKGKALQVWEVPNGREVARFEGHTSWVTAVTITPDGRYVVSGDHDGRLKVWELATAREVTSLVASTYSGPIGPLAVTPNGRYVVGSKLKTLHVWELASGKEVTQLEGHTEPIHALAVTPDSHYVVSGSGDWTLKVWELPGARTLASRGRMLEPLFTRLRKQAAVEVRREVGGWLGYYINFDRASATTSDGRYAVCHNLSELIVWRLPNGRRVFGGQGHSQTITAIAVSADDRYMVYGTLRGELRVRWKLGAWWEVVTLAGHDGLVSTVMLTADSRYVVSLGGRHDKLKVWELAPGQLAGGRDVASLQTQASLATKVRLSLFWRGKTVTTLTDDASVVTVTADGRYAVSGSWFRKLRIWELATGREVRAFGGHADAITALAVTPDGQYVVSGSRDQLVKIWELASGRELKTFAGHLGAITAVAVSPNGRYVVSGGEDKTLRVWELANGQRVAMFPVLGNVEACAVTPAGQIVCRNNSWRVFILRLEGVLTT